jgi:hypothetical protein
MRIFSETCLMKNKKNPKKDPFPMIGEAAKSFKISKKEEDFLIEICVEKKFKNIWIIKLNQLFTNMDEVDYYNQDNPP